MAERARWFAEILHAGLDTKLAVEKDLLAHATPAVLIAALPRDVLAKVFSGALTTNMMTPKSIIEMVSVELFAEKVPSNVLWACITQLADRAGIPSGKPADNAASREFLRRALASALATGVLVPKDVIEQVDAEVLATCFPDDITTKLLEVSLASGKLDAQLIIDTVGVPAIAQHAPVEVVWACFAKPGEAAMKAPPLAQPVKPAIEVVDEEVHSIFVDMDEELTKREKETPGAA